ncbi:hypothetical protein J6590_059952 [Homalodisca vitripennis]|nr:hypothetical protein J6590_059952 [Homalodisca vitripennis]
MEPQQLQQSSPRLQETYDVSLYPNISTYAVGDVPLLDVHKVDLRDASVFAVRSVGLTGRDNESAFTVTVPDHFDLFLPAATGPDHFDLSVPTCYWPGPLLSTFLCPLRLARTTLTSLCPLRPDWTRPVAVVAMLYNRRKSGAQQSAVPNLSESPRPPTTPSISLDEIGESQEHNISNILAVPDLSESPRPPTTPSISLDEIGESQEHNISNILACQTCPSCAKLVRVTRPPTTPSISLDEIGESQEHNISNIQAVPNLSESPRPPTTPSISLDEIGESQEHNVSNIQAVPNLSESPTPPTTPSISLDEIGKSQEHISNIQAVPNLSESPRPPTTPSISSDEIGESQEHTSAIFWLCQTCPSHRGLPPRRQSHWMK